MFQEQCWCMKTGQGEAISLMQCGANYQCMPLDPEYTLPFRRGVDGYMEQSMNFRCWAHMNTMSHVLLGINTGDSPDEPSEDHMSDLLDQRVLWLPYVRKTYCWW